MGAINEVAHRKKKSPQLITERGLQANHEEKLNSHPIQIFKSFKGRFH